jgi:hypothetical protein
MAMKAKMTGRCRKCRRSINIGDEITGERGKGWSHVTCPLFDPSEPVELVIPEGNGRLASEGQIELIESLLEERTPPREVTEAMPETLQLLASNQASAIIDALFASPKGPQAATPGPDEVPAGRYALEDGPSLQLVKVYRGSQNSDYVKVYDDDDSTHVYNAPAMLRRIVKVGVAHAATRYGQLRGRCWKCGYRLEQNISIELSMGPVCGARLYPKPVWKIKVQKARDAILERGEDPDAPAHKSVTV